MSQMTMPPPGQEPPGAKDKRTLKRFLKFIVLGYFVGTALGILGFAAILIGLGPDSVDIPWPYTLLVLYQAGMIGGFVGGGVFMARFKSEDDDDDQNGRGKPVGPADGALIASKQRTRPARPISQPGGPVPQPV